MVPPRPRLAPGRVVAVVVLVLGVAIGGLGVWWLREARPRPGAYIDVLALGRETAVAIRHEAGGRRGYVELLQGDRSRWNALVPPYPTSAGIGLAASDQAVSVRVVRDGRPEVFTLAVDNSAKLGSLLLDKDRTPSPTGYTLPRVVTVSDATQAIELFGVEGEWATAESVPLIRGGGRRWRIDLGAAPIADAWLGPDTLVIESGDGSLRAVRRDTGAAVDLGAGARRDPAVIELGAGRFRVEGDDRPRLLRGDGLHAVFAPAIGVLAVVDDAGAVRHQVRWPAQARPPAQQHLEADTLWLVLPDRVIALDLATLEPVLPAPGAAVSLEKASDFRLVAIP